MPCPARGAPALKPGRVLQVEQPRFEHWRVAQRADGGVTMSWLTRRFTAPDRADKTANLTGLGIPRHLAADRTMTM